MKLMLLLVAAAMAFPMAARAQSAPKIEVALDVEGPADAASTLGDDVRKGLASEADVSVVSRVDARRVVRLIVTPSNGVYGVSLLVTEQYDRPTLMVLGIEDDDLAGRMMMLQIVNEHQGFAGRDVAELARQIVAALDDGLFKTLRTLRQ
ncbi:MAG TPA: hypothetical protein VFA27_12520 [Vicinamibacterales bacterium]|nr:hypothetical protein [Vicinamibacterales bacterium]